MKIIMKSNISHTLRHKRTSTGAGIIAIGAILSFFAILPLSLLYFEMARFSLMQQQLRSITDFAALSGTAALASVSTGSSISDGQTTAMQQAVTNFKQNSVLQTQFSDSNVAATLNQTGVTLTNPTTAKTAKVNIVLLDQNGNIQATGSSTAVTIQVQAAYTDNTVFASQILPVQSLISVTAFSNGGLPKLDVVLCFDCSGSMDDLTPVYLLKRYYAGGASAQVVIATVPTTQNNSITGDTIYNIFGPVYTGTRINVVQPQGLEYCNFSGVVNGSQTNTVAYPWTEFSYPSSPNPLLGLRAGAANTGTLVPEQGSPPGNYNGGAGGTINGNDPTSVNYSTYFTDLVPAAVVNTTLNGHFFQNVDTCVEASRGNLESGAYFNSSKANTNSNTSGVSVGANWYSDYWTQARSVALPMSTALSSATTFFTTINTSTNAHFGLIAFANSVGTSSNSVWYDGTSATTNQNIDSSYSGGGTNNFPMPLIPLSSSASNYTNVTTAINGGSGALPLGPTGRTNIYAALNEAYNELTGTQVRTGTKKAIVLFTDGVPNSGSNGSAPDYGAYAIASNCGAAGIPIYTIGLSTNSDITPYETEVLGDGGSTTGSLGNHGIAWYAGNNGQYIATTVNSLNSAFQTIARSLVVLQ